MESSIFLDFYLKRLFFNWIQNTEYSVELITQIDNYIRRIIFYCDGILFLNPIPVLSFFLLYIIMIIMFFFCCINSFCYCYEGRLPFEVDIIIIIIMVACFLFFLWNCGWQTKGGTRRRCTCTEIPFYLHVSLSSSSFIIHYYYYYEQEE